MMNDRLLKEATSIVERNIIVGSVNDEEGVVNLKMLIQDIYELLAGYNAAVHSLESQNANVDDFS